MVNKQKSKEVEIPLIHGDLYGRVLHNPDLDSYEFEIKGRDPAHKKVCLSISNFLLLRGLRDWCNAVIEKYGQEYFRRND
jgi:hypothetical protein